VAEIAKYLGSIFVFIMIVTLIDFLYKWSAHWAKIYDEGAQIFVVIMILVSIFLYGMCIWFTYQNFDWFYNGNTECNTQKYFIYLSILTMIAVTVISLLKIHKDSSILASGGMCWIISFLTWSGLSYSEEPLCNYWLDHSRSEWFKLMMWLILFIITIIKGYFGENSAENFAEELARD